MIIVTVIVQLVIGIKVVVIIPWMYGKTIIKPVETDTIVKDNKEDSETYMFNITIIITTI